MKKIFGFLLLISLLILGGCGQIDKPNEDDPNGGSKREEKVSIYIHYNRPAKDYDNWALWLWKDDGHRFDFNGEDEFGKYAFYTLEAIGVTEEDKMGLIVAKNPGSTWDGKDGDADRYIDFSLYEKDEATNCYNLYIFQGDMEIYSNKDKLKVDNIASANFNTKRTVSVVTSNPVSSYKIMHGEEELKSGTVDNVDVFEVTLDQDIDISEEYSVVVEFSHSKATLSKVLGITRLFNEAFDEEYYYDGELGAIYSKEKTTFRVWSPVSKKIELKIYSQSGEQTVEMTKGEKGVFEATVNGDLEGKYYTYVVYNANYPNGKEIVDPYAKSAGTNGVRGMIVDFGKTNPEGWDEISALPIDRKALTIYELHVADLTSSSTWGGTSANAKKFLGLIEEGTTYTKDGVTVKTGFDHIKELGVNAVQLQPIFDQANDEVNVTFNWGYNPLNYNVLEGCYSSDPSDGYARIIEFKQVVKAYHDAGINIIMDVVYNHTNSVTGTNFDVLMPGYYFRYTDTGVLYNGSGCGNETASERLMFRKFMIDSTTFWLSEYKLGGFRFDLMGLHDLDTMEQLTKACQEINPAVTIFGEPWTGGTSGLASNKQAKQDNENHYVGYGAFNDKMRDELVKGGLNPANALSWISNINSNKATMATLVAGIQGITKVNAVVMPGPDYTVNYATCHDNYTLTDRFAAAGVKHVSNNKNMSMLANAIVFTSQGTSFMLAGEEFLRSKGGNSNSYNASYEVNELNYELKITHMDMFENYKKLIALKKDCAALHLDGEHNNFEVLLFNGDNTIMYKIVDTTQNREYVFIHQNGINRNATDNFDLSGYTLYLDTLGLHADEALGEVTMERFETIIAYKDLLN